MAAFLTLTYAGAVVTMQGAAIDTFADALPIPTRSSLTGLFGAALGVRRTEPDTLQALQDTMQVAVLVDEPGTVMRDFYTADLSQPHMLGPVGWHDGERARVTRRTGGDKERRIIGKRPLVTGFSARVIVGFAPDAPQTPAALAWALEHPVFPLCLGSRACLPDPFDPVVVEADSLLAAIQALPKSALTYAPAGTFPAGLTPLPVEIPGLRDWRTRRHGGVDAYHVL